MELLGGFHSCLDLENHGFIRCFHWNLHLDSTSGVQVINLNKFWLLMGLKRVKNQRFLGLLSFHSFS